jgi:cytochrome c-type biogenesis protein CcmF
VEDLYLTLVSSPNDAGTITVGVFINPMVVWLWTGGGVMVAGTLLAAWPKRRRGPTSRVRTARPARPVPPERVLEEVIS